MEFVKDQYRHCKPILALGASSALLEAAGAPRTLPDGSADEALLCYDSGAIGDALEAFTAALIRHRNWRRESDPPLV
jgi:catalase